MFVNLRGRSTYSMLEGIGSIESIVKQAKSLGQSSVAMTDLYGIYGAIDFYKTTTSHDVSPIIGVELPYISHRNLVGTKRGVVEGLGTMTLLARSTAGYVDLLHLISEAYDIAVEGFPILDNQLLVKYSKDIYVMLGGLHSYAYKAIDENNNTDQVQNHFDEIRGIIDKKNILITTTAQKYSDYKSLKLLDEVSLRYAQSHNISMITTSIFYYPFENQKEVYETALAIKDNKRTYRNDSRKISGKHHIFSEEEIIDNLDANGHSQEHIKKLIETTSKVADSVKIEIDIGQVLFPDYKVPDEIENLYKEQYENLIQD